VSRIEETLRLPPGSQVPAALRLLIATGLAHVGAAEGSFLVHDADAGDLCFVMTVGNDETEAILLGQRVPVGAGITGLAAERREVQIGTPTYTALVHGAAGPEAVLAAPVLANGVLLGVMTAVSFEAGRRFDVAAAQSFGAMAVLAGVLIDLGQQLARH
jgi:hypothetical protein